jgi:hypothetical protein
MQRDPLDVASDAEYLAKLFAKRAQKEPLTPWHVWRCSVRGVSV